MEEIVLEKYFYETLYEKKRPLSLLNIDYKIATKDIANIIKKELSPIISPSQTGFIGGRFIGENIWTTLYCIQYLKDMN